MINKNFLNKISIISLTFLIGLGCIFALRYFQDRSEIQIEYTENNIISGVKFTPSEEQVLSLLKVDGFYYLNNENPVGFNEIKHFRIKTKTLESKNEGIEKWKPISPEGFIQTDRKFNFELMKINENQIDFVTENIDGINYQFSGCYVDTKYLSFPKKGDVSLVGHLIKKQNNKKITETKFGLGWYADLLCAL